MRTRSITSRPYLAATRTTQLGLSCQRPLFRAYQQDLSLFERCLRDEFPKIRARARYEKAEISFADESATRSEFHSGTTWAPDEVQSRE